MNVTVLILLIVHVMISEDEYKRSRSASHAYEIFRTSLLQPLMRVRVPNTLGNVAVRKFIEMKLSSLGWEVVVDRFTEDTPLGPKTFTNIVATKDPDVANRLVLACHYDSKYFPDDSPVMFVGATDSAVPCAMMLHIATFLASSSLKVDKTTIQLLFFDGEEAFVNWSDNDSLYGSRHLADLMGNLTLKNHGNPDKSLLDSIEVFILLDLIGAKNPRFYCIIPQTCHLLEKLAVIENDLVENEQLFGDMTRHKNYFCPPSAGFSHLADTIVMDDHIPFKNKGVPTLPLISIPFPDVWHTYHDDETAIDPETVMNIISILEVFVKNYLNLD